MPVLLAFTEAGDTKVSRSGGSPTRALVARARAEFYVAVGSVVAVSLCSSTGTGMYVATCDAAGSTTSLCTYYGQKNLNEHLVS